jgi:hypothetical protein
MVAIRRPLDDVLRFESFLNSIENPFVANNLGVLSAIAA